MDLGAKYVRTDFRWNYLEPDRGRWDEDAFAFYDWYLNTAGKKSLDLIVILYGDRTPQGNPLPAWAFDLYKRTPDAFMGEFSEYAAEVAKRYGSRVHYYQIWNEPNVHHVVNLWPILVSDWISKSYDVKLFESGYNGIKQYDPDFETMINLAATRIDWQKDLRDYMVNGAWGYLDIIGIDHYPWKFEANDWSNLGQLFIMLDDYSKKYRRVYKAAVLETGYHTGNVANDPDFSFYWCYASHYENNQREFINRALPAIRNEIKKSSINLGVAYAMSSWYEIIDWTYAAGAPMEKHFGILKADMTKKLGYDDLKNQIDLFKSEEYAVEIGANI